ncbi:MAG: AbrB/MazE/SpoVT family DNA-binding domain-containing protein [Pseudomonadota bacterium]|nr:AbrB/MazE/SpoVT family DNA-binding domain-containing protein [Pseudomonadota bacterium]
MNKPVTKLSTKGQVIVPKEIRERRKWKSGMRLIVEETPEGVLLKPEPLFPPATLDEVAGSLKYHGPPKTLEEMDRAISEEVETRRARGRY